ncbi:MAG TPA: hypothetical protein PK646_05360 [Bacillota bacterium]|jgi:hypothetical protein|nr:hypothetical protein [Fastidiosipila sp.]HPX93185.1 hypothetical protein [Bacillota bacterium]HQB81498.1 hypothetical protein [Bacillota bacterium]
MYVDAIVGGKGSGKTPQMLEEMASEAVDENANIIFIEYGHGDHLVPHAVRRIDIKEYPVRGLDQLIAFLAGMNAKDYDISHIYLDCIYQVAGQSTPAELSAFMKKLEILARQADCKITAALSYDPADLPEEIRPFAR